jgi:hypothetical protein
MFESKKEEFYNEIESIKLLVDTVYNQILPFKKDLNIDSVKNVVIKNIILNDILLEEVFQYYQKKYNNLISKYDFMQLLKWAEEKNIEPNFNINKLLTVYQIKELWKILN